MKVPGCTYQLATLVLCITGNTRVHCSHVYDRVVIEVHHRAQVHGMSILIVIRTILVVHEHLEGDTDGT